MTASISWRTPRSVFSMISSVTVSTLIGSLVDAAG